VVIDVVLRVNIRIRILHRITNYKPFVGLTGDFCNPPIPHASSKRLVCSWRQSNKFIIAAKSYRCAWVAMKLRHLLVQYYSYFF
jgi:hypothetical protein